MRKLAHRLIAASLGTLISIGLAELMLRVVGFEPWHYKTIDANEPTLHEFDPVLGWRNKAGHYTLPAYGGFGLDNQLTFLEDGSRATSTNLNRNPGRNNVIVSGCSFTQGWAVSDHETYSWKLQEMFPAANFYNCGTAGYGTYQSLLMLERVLPRIPSPKVVVFGFIVEQEVRNVAPAAWLRYLTLYSRRAHVYLPYVTIGPDGKLIRHAPQRYALFPFRDHSALVTLAEWSYMRLRTAGRWSQSHPATEKVLLEMRQLVERYGGELLVVLLDGTDEQREAYRTFLEKNGVACLDCSHPMTADLRVPGEGHPNGRLHSLWAECIGDRLHGPLK
ncbi:MAG: hypothetical protein MUF81_02430 [Verrucomicrobia bacterium]|nr:hypothetical protein [Verrucomicrobiota bacterium]